jgi:hypothetical protein
MIVFLLIRINLLFMLNCKDNLAKIRYTQNQKALKELT